MLTLTERILFAIAVLATLYTAWRVAFRIIRTIARGQGKVDWNLAKERLISIIIKIGTLQPVFRFRFWVSLFHGLVAWGFIYYLLVNLGDVLEGYFPDFHILGTGTLGNLYRFGADILSVGVILGMTALIIRRFAFKPTNLTTRKEVLIYPKARIGIPRDSAIVGGFIIIHVGSRFLGQSFKIAAAGGDVWQPFGSIVASLWSPFSPMTIIIAEHIFFWLATGTILLFIPYFLYSKHLHLFLAPVNYLLKPQRRSIGELSRLDFDDETIEQFGATHIEDLEWELILDAYACIMCFRCQEVCPAYNTGKVLSPAAMEINKRYFLNSYGASLTKGEPSKQPLVEFAIPPEAVWACTACGACVDICPVGNEPMRDILDIRRALVLMENDFPEQLQTAYRGMERTVNPWNIPPSERLSWAEGLDVPTIDKNPDPDILWWVGCAPATDARAQKTARAFARILNATGVNYAVLGQQEQCTGDSARRSGNEFLFNELALANVELLDHIAPKRIVTTCPHCLHTLKNEYPAFNGNYQVVHHTQFINELMKTGQLKLKSDLMDKITYHDPCYLGRQNNILSEPRHLIKQTHPNFVELPRHAHKSFCCGAGGAQMWKEEEEGTERVSSNRLREAQQSGTNILAVGCPFCMIMLDDVRKSADTEMQLLDIAEIVEQAME
jgi:Fe-S oxidoreductase